MCLCLHMTCPFLGTTSFQDRTFSSAMLSPGFPIQFLPTPKLHLLHARRIPACLLFPFLSKAKKMFAFLSHWMTIVSSSVASVAKHRPNCTKVWLQKECWHMHCFFKMRCPPVKIVIAKHAPHFPKPSFCTFPMHWNCCSGGHDDCAQLNKAGEQSLNSKNQLTSSEPFSAATF